MLKGRGADARPGHDPAYGRGRDLWRRGLARRRRDDPCRVDAASGRRTTPSTSIRGSMPAWASRPSPMSRPCRGAGRSSRRSPRRCSTEVDVFIAPTIRCKAPTLLSTDVDAGTPGALDAFNMLSLNTRPINYMGLPSVSAPCGLDSNGTADRLPGAGTALRRGQGAEGRGRLPARYRLPPRTAAGVRGIESPPASSARLAVMVGLVPTIHVSSRLR